MRTRCHLATCTYQPVQANASQMQWIFQSAVLLRGKILTPDFLHFVDGHDNMHWGSIDHRWLRMDTGVRRQHQRGTKLELCLSAQYSALCPDRYQTGSPFKQPLIPPSNPRL